MKSVKLAFIYGFLVWVIPFVIAFLIFPLRTSDRPFFESIMPVAVTVVTVLFTVLYFKKVENSFLKEGILLGIFFFAVSIAIDLLMFSKGPMAMPFVDYIKDIGFTYLLIPAITIGVGHILVVDYPVEGMGALESGKRICRHILRQSYGVQSKEKLACPPSPEGRSGSGRANGFIS